MDQPAKTPMPEDENEPTSARPAAPLKLVSSQSDRIEKLLQQIQRLELDKSALEKTLDGILESKSWRLTQPLRNFGSWKRSCFPLLRFERFEFDLEQGRHTQLSQGKVKIEGASPSVSLKSKSSRFPNDWAVLKCKLKASREHMYFALYYRGEHEYCEQHRVFLPLADEAVSEHLVRLPADTKGLRLDPFNTEGEFSFDQLTIQEIGKLQLFWRLFNKHVRPWLFKPTLCWAKLKKLLAILRAGGFTALRIRLLADSFTNNYQQWVERYDTLTDSDRQAIRAHINNLDKKPLISVLMPTYNTPERWLRRAIESVQAQLYTNWELCVADDSSTDPHVRQILEEYSSKDSRIKIFYRKSNGHIAKTSNDALALATGEYVALLDHDDELSEHALYLVVNEINSYPDAALIYSDEDKLTSYGLRFNPYFKSDWNFDLLLAQNFVCHLTVLQSALIKRIGGFRSGVDGAQDWDLILRASVNLQPAQIRHIPHVLYHWRVIEGSTAQSTGYKPYVLQAQQNAVADHLKARGIEGAKVEILEHIAQLRVRFPIPHPNPKVSIIIPTRDKLELLKRCVDSILEKTTYRNFEIIIIDNGSVEPETATYFDQLQSSQSSTQPKVTILPDNAPFNFSRLNNRAVEQSTSELVAFLNNDLEVINPEWLREMVSYAVRADVGAVGARLLWPNDLLQHGGVILGIAGVAGHNHKGRRREDPGYFNRAILPQDLSAVTAACLVMRREVFKEIGGFEEKELSVAFNDVDLCLRIRRAGYLIVYNPYAELYHHESASRGYENTPEKFLRFEKEIENMKKRWKEVLLQDPYYNPNLTLLTEDFAFAFPPRARKPWLSSSAG